MSPKQNKYAKIAEDSEILAEQLGSSGIRELSDEEVLEVSGGGELPL